MEANNGTETKDEFVTAQGRRLIGLLPMFLLVLIVFLRISWSLYKSFGQKTRNPQQRRMYVGTRARTSIGQTEPSIFVSPANLPPPPKYECMAPPSYEEVVGVHNYPNYPAQPISQPITAALAQSTSSAQTTNTTNITTEATAPAETVVTVSNERRTSVARS